MRKQKTTKATAEKPVTATARNRKGINLNVWLPEQLMGLFEKLRHKHKRTITAEIELMMEQYLVANGMMEEPEDADE